MASQHIKPSTQTPLANDLNQIVTQMWALDALMRRVKAIADQVSNGQDWTTLASKFGFANATEAETFYNLFAGALVYWQDTPNGGPNAVQYMMQRMG